MDYGFDSIPSSITKSWIQNHTTITTYALLMRRYASRIVVTYGTCLQGPKVRVELKSSWTNVGIKFYSTGLSSLIRK